MVFIAGVFMGNLLGMFIMALLVGTHDCDNYERPTDIEKDQAFWDQANIV